VSISGDGVNVCHCYFCRIRRIFLTSGLQYNIRRRYVDRVNMNPQSYFVYRNILSIKITRIPTFKSIWQDIRVHTTVSSGKHHTPEKAKQIHIMAHLTFLIAPLERRSI